MSHSKRNRANLFSLKELFEGSHLQVLSSYFLLISAGICNFTVYVSATTRTTCIESKIDCQFSLILSMNSESTKSLRRHTNRANHNFKKPKAMCPNCLFCSTNNPKL